ncbi:MAG: cation:proton antiporter [Elusimicrobiota bacterium]|nr:cation:proton antiporter [Elusimicrobiota bacterium]
MNPILAIGFILLTSLGVARFIGRIKLPAVTAYLLLGILIGPSILHFIPDEVIGISGLISNVVLGFVAFTLGQNFSKDNFLRVGKPVLWISILEAVFSWVLVTIVFLVLLKQPLYVSILFGAISSATAPAATLMVVRESRAKGIFTDTLLGVVAIDDAWCLIIFAISLSIAKAIYIPTKNPHILEAILTSIMHILGALILGGMIAFIIHSLSGIARTAAEFLTYTLAFLLLNTGLAIYFHLSVLLANMFLGAILINIHHTSFRFFDTLKTVDYPLYIVFFVLAGANLEIHLLERLGILGIAYIIVRIAGKVTGASLGGIISNAEEKIRKYLGWGLLPQAGVALGTALIAKAEFPSVGNMVLSTIVATTVAYEIIGPICTKIALLKAKECTI